MTQSARFVRFGVFELDLRTGELRKRGVKVHLQEQPFRVLAMLVERAGDLVTREDLRQRLWPEAVFVDFDIGLNKAVAKLRTALGDSAASPRFIETLERRGYRFMADVTQAAQAGLPPRAAEAHAPSPATERPSGSPCAGSAGGLVRLLWDGRTVALAEGVHLIGRDPGAAVWVDSSVVSRRHASITVRGNEISIEDHSSRNGTFVNGTRIYRPCALVHADELRIGPARLVVSAPITIAPTDADLP
jgi:DNA-binding winged helix-turn-helix (wHTH) protein